MTSFYARVNIMQTYFSDLIFMYNLLNPYCLMKYTPPFS